MSLYNQLFEIDILAPVLLQVLRMDVCNIPRFRDCYLNEDGTRVVVLTRTGGGNRAEYESENKALAQCPGYVSDEDVGSDNTYAYFYFEPPREFREKFKKMAPEHGRRPAIERFFDLVKKLNDPEYKDDPEVVRALEVGRRIVDQMQGATILHEATADMENPPDNVTIIEM